ncbi:RNA polymerase sigma factor [Candidatus Omnitrophota bacterium]
MTIETKIALFNRYYTRYFQKISRYIQSKFRQSEAVAEDLTQDAFIKVYENIEKLVDQRVFIRWVFVVARNGAFNYLRSPMLRSEVYMSNKVRVGENEKEIIDTLIDTKNKKPDEALINDEMRASLSSALGKLSEHYRRAVELCCIEERSYRKAALILQTRESIIAHNLMRAKRMLSEMEILSS